MANENKINWTLVVLGTILCIGLYLIPSPLQSNHRILVHTHDSTWVVLGTPDTSGNNVPSIAGNHTSNSTITTPASDTDSTELQYPFFYAEVKDSTKEGDKVYIQVYTYPYKEADTLKAETNILYEIQPRPAVTITRVDTVYLMNPVEEVPFYEKPYVVAPVTAAVIVTLVYIIAGAFK